MKPHHCEENRINGEMRQRFPRPSIDHPHNNSTLHGLVSSGVGLFKSVADGVVASTASLEAVLWTASSSGGVEED